PPRGRTGRWQGADQCPDRHGRPGRVYPVLVRGHRRGPLRGRIAGQLHGPDLGERPRVGGRGAVAVQRPGAGAGHRAALRRASGIGPEGHLGPVVSAEPGAAADAAALSVSGTSSLTVAAAAAERGRSANGGDGVWRGWPNTSPRTAPPR